MTLCWHTHFLLFSGYPEGYRISTQSFLFRFEKKIGQPFENQVLGIKQVHKLIQWRKDRGPVFGVEELVITSNMKQATTSNLTNYTHPSGSDKNGSSTEYLLGERFVSLHAVEVLAIGGNPSVTCLPYRIKLEGKWNNYTIKTQTCLWKWLLRIPNRAVVVIDWFSSGSNCACLQSSRQFGRFASRLKQRKTVLTKQKSPLLR